MISFDYDNDIGQDVINFENPIEYSLEQWETNSEFTTISQKELNGSAYGLKYWILTRYRVCETFDLEYDPVYMDKNFKYDIDKNMEGKIYTDKFDGVDFSIYQGVNPFYHRDSNDTFSYTIVSSKPTETQVPIDESTETQTSKDDLKPTSTTVVEPTQNKVPTPKFKCLSELAGYPCCPEAIKTVYETDAYGDWGYDFSKKEWCGLTPYEEHAHDENCWSESLAIHVVLDVM